MEKISVIVPVYNVEKYLDECIQSLLNQDYKNIEILLIDDGSTDNSSRICDEYASRNSNVFSFHKKNGGLSDARNYGIKKSSGKYLAFVDSDDFVSRDFLSFMYNNLKKNNVKISSCGFCKFYDKGKMSKINFDNIDKKYNYKDAHRYLNILGYFNVSACNKLFDKDLFYKIQFPVGKKSEDWFVMYKLIEESKAIYYSSIVKYFYRQRIGSIAKSHVINYDCIDAAEEAYLFYKNNLNEIVPYAAQSLSFALIGVYNSLLYKNSQDANIKKEMKEIRNRVLTLKHEITYKKTSNIRKMKLFLFLYFRTIYSLIFKLYNKMRKK